MTPPTGEQFRLRFMGGPCEGDITTTADGYEWPLPDELGIPHLVEHEAGVYRKVRESNLPPQAPDSNLIRGAEYVWEERHGC